VIFDSAQLFLGVPIKILLIKIEVFFKNQISKCSQDV
jgi:hypothetical protein